MDRERIILLLKLYLGTFAVLFIAGLLAGSADRKPMVRAAALAYLNAHIMDDRMYLVAACKGKSTHVYDVDKNQVRTVTDTSKIGAISAALFSVRAHRELLTSAIGTGSGAITFKSLGETKKQRGRGAFLAVLMGIVTGYPAGYAVATYLDLSCASSSIQSFLDEQSNWERLEREFLSLTLFNLGIREKFWAGIVAPNAEDEYSRTSYERFELSPLTICKPEITEQALSLLSKINSIGEIGAADFMIAKRYWAALQKTGNHDRYFRLHLCIARAIGTDSYVKRLKYESALLRHILEMERIDDDGSLAPCHEFGIAKPKVVEATSTESEAKRSFFVDIEADKNASKRKELLKANPMFQKACQVALKDIVQVDDQAEK